MPLPWLRIIDGVLGATDVMRWAKNRAAAPGPGAVDRPAAAGIEARLAGVVVAALREAFDRDHQRLEIERQRIEEERARAERAMRLELLRQAGDREIGRLRLLASVAAGSFLASLFLVTRIVGGTVAARVWCGFGWLLLVSALAAAFSAQGVVAGRLTDLDERSTIAEVTSTGGGVAALWLVVVGLAALALGVLLA
jgi:hypothetical protein